ncbi:hypothetical protein JW758_00950 [Candidatus Peregrinibacteria bacterium]|nr:hypothetical protein [Candidatus Peregrinibacteria bacterium]
MSEVLVVKSACPDSFGRLIERLGHNVDVTADSSEALKLMRDKVYAMVVTGLRIHTENDGLRVASEASKTATKVVILSGLNKPSIQLPPKTQFIPQDDNAIETIGRELDSILDIN